MPQFLKTSSIRHRFSYAVTAVTALSLGGGRLGSNDIRQPFSASDVSHSHLSPVHSDADPIMVVELFTSESCPECPPAEDSLVAFRQAAGGSHVTLIPLAFHVAYWNKMGWRDPYSDTSYTRRQRAYNGKQLYTPQAVVNGVTKTLSTSLLHSPTALTRSVTIEPGPSGTQRTVTVRVAAPSSSVPSSDTLNVYLALTEDSVVAHITAGDNKGRDIRHVGIVRYFSQIATIGDTATTVPSIAIPTVSDLQHGHIAIFVQTVHAGRLGAIVGAGTIPL
jgi:hypothetical protein